MKNYVLATLFMGIMLQPIVAQTVTTFNFGDPDDAIALDSNDNIYASSFIEETIYKFTPSGDGTEFITGLTNPNGIDFDSSDRLYVCDWGANEIKRYLIDGTFDTAITIPGRPSGMLKAFDNEDMIYPRYQANTINRVTPNGVLDQVSDASELDGPVGLAYDENNNLYVANYNNRIIYRVGANGNLTYVATVGGSSRLGFITFGKGRLWATVLGEHKIYTVNHNAVDDVTLFAGSSAGSQDGDISQATFNQPNGIRFNDAETILYITDFGTKNLRVITDISLGISSETFTTKNFALYPNPASHMLEIQGKHISGIITIELLSMEGKLLQRETISAANNEVIHTMPVLDLASGSYLVRIKTVDGVITKQWIKK